MTVRTADELPRCAFLAPDLVDLASTTLAGGPYPKVHCEAVMPRDLTRRR